MNPLLLNHLQSQNQPMLEGIENPIPSSQPYNPFNAGIRSALEAARESLSMTQKQQDKALRSSLLTFGDAIAQQPREKGFWKNFGSVGRALSPAIRDYDNQESQHASENQALANQILAYQAAEEAKQAANEERLWRRQHEENKLAETSRYHDLINQRNIDSINAGYNENNFGDFLPLTDRRLKFDYQKDRKAIGTVLHDIKNIEKKYKEFREKYTNNIIDPMGPLSDIANPTKDFLGRFSKNKKLREETADRKALNSQLNEFVAAAERALKGGGVLGPTIIKMFKEQGIYPDLEHDTPETFDSKINRIVDHLSHNYKAADLSLKYNLQLTPYDVDEFEEKIKSPISNQADIDQTIVPTEEIIVMTDPSGQSYDIPISQKDKALQHGLIPLK